MFNSIAFLEVGVIFLPLIASIIGAVKLLKEHIALIVMTNMMLTAAIFSIIMFFYIIFGHHITHIKLLKWFDFDNFQAFWSIYIDSLGAVMICVINVVSFIVYLYSIGYMSDDKSKLRFMTYLSLFTFFMLSLVTSDNLLQLFAGWEGVGLSSFLLIGFWFHKKSASAAAMKAFVINRIGDIGLVLAIILIAFTFESIEYKQIFTKCNYLSSEDVLLFGVKISTLDIICILMFIGCMGKSAQLGLHTWLPDAMEGPTPASALIHAATMVTAGIFLVTRCSFIFEQSQLTLNIITIIGAITCFFGASIAITQNNIKKIIAYSTCSQLGYMFLACGISQYSVAIFHLVNHAFFKALLFLCAGSITYGIHHEQNIKKMGGLYKVLPQVYVLMWAASLALIGIYPLSGYFSKDLILINAYIANTKFGFLAFCIGTFSALLTAFYSCRLILLVFHKKTKLNNNILKHLRRPSKSMLISMIALSIGSILSGYIGKEVLRITSYSGNFWNKSIVINLKYISNKQTVPIIIHYLPSIMAIVGTCTALHMYLNDKNYPKLLSNKIGIIYHTLFRQYYFNEIYNFIFVKTLKQFSLLLWKIIDNSIIDGIINAVARIILDASKISRHLQTGFIYHYTFLMFTGILSVVLFIVLKFIWILN